MSAAQEISAREARLGEELQSDLDMLRSALAEVERVAHAAQDRAHDEINAAAREWKRAGLLRARIALLEAKLGALRVAG